MIDQVLSTIRDHDRFFITTHIRPDGDALGSQLALGRFLNKLGKHATMINSDDPPYNLGWMPGIEAVEKFEGTVRQHELIDAADVVLILDTNAMERVGKLASPVENSQAPKVLIDHHTHPEDVFDVMLARDTASSTGELVYEVITAYDASMIDTEIATTLYTAIMTDTGSFRYSNVTARVHRIVADLLDRGEIKPAPIHTAVFDTRSIQGLRLLGMALKNITLRYGGQVGYAVLTKRMLREAGASKSETEGLVNYILSVESVKAAVLFSEANEGTKMSFRSKGDTYVNEWARAFGGGGHRNASGAYVKRPLDDVIPDVMDAVPEYLDLEMPEDDVSLSPEDASYLSSLMQMKSQNG